jgi:hypothetical protein
MGRWPESETITLTGPGPSIFASHQYSVTASSLRALVSNYYEDTTLINTEDRCTRQGPEFYFANWFRNSNSKHPVKAKCLVWNLKAHWFTHTLAWMMDTHHGSSMIHSHTI